MVPNESWTYLVAGTGDVDPILSEIKEIVVPFKRDGTYAIADPVTRVGLVPPTVIRRPHVATVYLPAAHI